MTTTINPRAARRLHELLRDEQSDMAALPKAVAAGDLETAYRLGRRFSERPDEG